MVKDRTWLFQFDRKVKLRFTFSSAGFTLNLFGCV